MKANAFGAQKPGTIQDKAFFSEETLKKITGKILENGDTEWGGFGNAPKFPQTFAIQYLLRQFHFQKDDAALAQALLSLDKMIGGGIFDQIGGGFARYSTDVKWLAPHFEKMLYDNALLMNAMCEAYQLTGKKHYKRAIDQTLEFIEREMSFTGKNPSHHSRLTPHGFYSALDADSEGVEGKFYTWQKEEIVALLGDDAELFCEFYGVSDEGNWEETNILWVQELPAAFAAKKGMTEEALDKVLINAGNQLLQHRAKRIRPALDDKILLGWNALMNTAYSKAFAATGNTSYREKAIGNMSFIEQKFKQGEDSWYHTFKDGQAKIPAFLDDLAYLIQAYIHLQEITGNGSYLLKARQLTQWVIANFVEKDTGFFFFTPESQRDIVVRKKEVYDGATPSGNAIMVANLLYLSVVFDQANWREHAHDLLRSLAKAITDHPTSFCVWALSLQTVIRGQQEIAVIGQQANQFLGLILKPFIPNKILQAAETKTTDFPLLMGKEIPELGNEVSFYLCKDYICSKPFTKIEQLLANV